MIYIFNILLIGLSLLFLILATVYLFRGVFVKDYEGARVVGIHSSFDTIGLLKDDDVTIVLPDGKKLELINIPNLFPYGKGDALRIHKKLVEARSSGSKLDLRVSSMTSRKRPFGNIITIIPQKKGILGHIQKRIPFNLSNN